MRILAILSAACAAAAALSAGAALAHAVPGGGFDHLTAFAAGVRHPLSGLDHVLAMVAVGLWAGWRGGRALVVWPAAFIGLMVAGGALGMASAPLPVVQAGILASLIVLGLMILAGVALPVRWGATLIGLFALAHGHAHGAEMPAAAAALPYAVGFVLATAALHAVGVATACLGAAAHAQRAVRGGGALIALAGIVLAAT